MRGYNITLFPLAAVMRVKFATRLMPPASEASTPAQRSKHPRAAQRSTPAQRSKHPREQREHPREAPRALPAPRSFP